MAVEIWQDEHVENTFQMYLLDEWTWHEFENAAGFVRERRVQETPTNIIINIEGPLPIPPNLEDYAPDYLQRHIQSNGGLLVFVTDWGIVQTVMKMLSSSMNMPFGFVHFSHSIEDAHHLIQAQRPLDATV